jgi:type IV secretory pathway VirJ component
MKMAHHLGFVLFFLAFAAQAAAQPPRPQEDTLEMGAFGKVVLYRPEGAPRQMVLFLSGDGGWNRGVIGMAQLLVSQGAAVAGIDVPHYLHQIAGTHEKCSYPAGDLAELAQAVERRLGIKEYVNPVLVGYSSGATLAYAALAEAPPNTFRGAISMGFCPDLPLTKPFCRGNGLEGDLGGPKGKDTFFRPVAHLNAPWIAFQGEADKLCSKDQVVRFAGQVSGAETVLLPKVGHGFSVQGRWAPQLIQAFHRITSGPAPVRGGAGDLKDLPLVEVPTSRPQGDLLAVIYSGDGGWASLDREVAQALSARGVPVVGMDSLRYFWTARTPEEGAGDLARLLRHYLAAWKREKVLLVGYSFGADALPFLASRLPADLAERIRLLALIGPSHDASLEIHVAEWLGGGKGEYRVLPELKKLAGRPLLCLYGQKDDDSLCPDLPKGQGQAAQLPGGHHFGGDYESVARLLLASGGVAGVKPEHRP